MTIRTLSFPFSGRTPCLRVAALIINVFCWVLAVGFSHSCAAAPDETAVPAQFDRPTVQNLIDHIDEGHNSSLLKGAYFNPHALQALPLTDGYKILKTALQAEKPDSKRWFYLQSTSAFAVLRIGPGNINEGLDAYGVMFDHAPQAMQTSVFYPLQRAVYEYVFTMPTQYVMASSDNSDNAVKVLFKAFSAYLQLLKVKQEGKFEPDWERVMVYTALDNRFSNAVGAALKDPAMPKTLQLYKMAALVYRYSDPGQAIKLLQEAKAALPANDATQARGLYGLLVDQAEAMSNWPLAIASQKELIQRTGEGRARLAMLYLKSNDGKDYSMTMAQLRAPDANEQDITDFAAMLLNWAARDAKRLPRARTEAESLLRGYLHAARTRSTDQELVARLILAQSYLEQKRYAEARTVLDVSHLKPGAPDSDTALLYAEAQQMQRQIGREGTEPARPAPKPTANKPLARATIPKSGVVKAGK